MILTGWNGDKDFNSGADLPSLLVLPTAQAVLSSKHIQTLLFPAFWQW